MTNGYGNLKPNITLQTGAVFSAAMAASGAVPLSSVTFTDLPEHSFSLTLEAECLCGENLVFRFPAVTFPSFDSRLCGEKAERTALIRFSAEDFEIGHAYLNTLLAPADALLTVKAIIGDVAVTADARIQLLPRDEWLGLEIHPETLAAFVCPNSEAVENLAAGISPQAPFSALSDNTEILRNIVKNIRDGSMICAARDSYSPERRQRIKSHAALCIPNAVAATPMELALLFCAAAERCGFAPMIAFATNLSGMVSLFCGVRAAHVKSGTGMVSESLSKIRAMLENGELILFDPAVLSSAQSIDISLAAAEAHGYFSKVSTKLVAALDIAEARACGVAPFYSESEPVKAALPDEPSHSARDELVKLYNGLSGSRIFKALSGEYGTYDVLPLVGFDPDGLVCGQSVRIGPMEISEKPARFAGLADDFASFALKDERAVAYNKAELEEARAAFSAFQKRIVEKKYVVSGLYEKTFHEKISRMTFGKAPGLSGYAIAGFLRLCERESGETRYLPLSFVRVSFARKFDYFFCPETDTPVINGLAAASLDVKLPKNGNIDSVSEVFAFFEKAVKDARPGEYSDIRVIRETALIKADLAEYILWSNIGSYARTMLKNKNFESLLVKKAPEENRSNPDMSRPVLRFAPQTVKDALAYDGNVLFSAANAQEKADFIVNTVALSLADGKSVLAVSEDPPFLDFAAKELKDAGLDETVLDLDACRTSHEVIEAVKERLAALSDLERTSAAPQTKNELEETAARLKSYAKRLTETDSSLGVSLLELVESFDNAYDFTENTELLPVEKAATENLNGEKLDALFDLAERLVKTSRVTLGEVGLPDSAPLKSHPLYALAPEKMPDDALLHEVYELIARILPALSEYRETFFEISPMLGMKISDITDLAGLYALNELYKLFISAREYDIPADFASHGLSAFADGESRRSHAKKRMENIEYQLRFFSPELFEDVDPLLSGYNGESDDKAGFIKKFLVKKNHKDVLLQYVPAQNRAEFAKHPVSDIYKLLDEYRTEKAAAGESGIPEDENAESLAVLVGELKNVLLKLYPADADDERKTDARLARLFLFITRLCADPALSKKLTFARARFAQVYSENECMLEKLAALLGADFRCLDFETGILNYDGLSAYLKRVEENLPALSGWVNWLDAWNMAKPLLPAFSAYLCETGSKPGTDRLFASSLLLPAVRFLVHKTALDTDREAITRAREKYPSLCEKSAVLSLETALQTHRQRVKHYDETENLVSLLEADAALPVNAFAAKHKKHLLRVFPVLLVNTESIGDVSHGESFADTVLCDDASHLPLTLAAVAAAKRAVLFTHIRRLSAAARMLLETGALRVSLASDKTVFSGSFARKTSVSAVMVNGAMRFPADLANPAEAEQCVAKALELAENGQRTAIFAFTHGQCAYIRHLLCVTAENDKNVRARIESGLVAVRDAYEPCYETFENAVFSFAAAADTEGALCRAFCTGSTAEFRNALGASLKTVVGQAVFVTSLSAKELDLFGKRSAAARELYYALRYAVGGVRPFDASELSESSVLCETLLEEHPDMIPALGALACGADLISPDGTTAYLYDCLNENDLPERLDICERLNQNGIKCMLVSPLDAVWELGAEPRGE